MSKKAAFEISFGWLFALIAGAIILFFAIYFSIRLIGTEKEIISAETGKEIGILLNPLETSFESGRTTSISIPAETRIFAICDNSTGDFGRQIIKLEQKNFGKWAETDVDVFFNNKYIFSEQGIEGRKFYIFSKPFEFPFKIADLIYMTSADDIYCFIGAPNSVEEEIIDLNQSNLLVEGCAGNSIEICFEGSCDIEVDYRNGIVEKDGKSVYFEKSSENSDALMYAAIFSDRENYECQIQRLMMRMTKLVLLYREKEIRSSKEGCGENLGTELDTLRSSASGLDSSRDLALVKIQADTIEEKNDARICMLW